VRRAGLALGLGSANGGAERLRIGALETTVYKAVGAFATLRQLVKVHAMIVRDTVRVQNRIKALFRGQGVRVVGAGIYQPAKREEHLRALPVSTRAAASLVLAQYDAIRAVREQAHKQLVAESHRPR
jgi:hypothetical protein